SAQTKAQELISEAKKESTQIVDKAKEEAARNKKNSEIAIAQAARDLGLVVKEQIIKLFEATLKNIVKTELNEEFLSQLIIKLIEEWAQGKDVIVSVDGAQAEKLKTLVMSKVRDTVKDGVTIQIDERIASGFRIGMKGDDLVYDFTDDGIFDMLRIFVSPKISDILNENK
ncbi:MAG: hypothetical protein PHZ27_04440, partial [Candidatus Omnitrophica bacterium]|nr:hypothetical protein [Candidatus Omnitrophota bacterium]